MVRWDDSTGSGRERLDPALLLWLASLGMFLLLAAVAVHFAGELTTMISGAFEGVTALEGGWSP
jgi:hypothetical protein